MSFSPSEKTCNIGDVGLVFCVFFHSRIINGEQCMSKVYTCSRSSSVAATCVCAGERPYRCPVEGCTKAFRQLSSLQQHLKGHNIPMPKSYPVSRGAPIPPQLLLQSPSPGISAAAAGPIRSSPSSGSPPDAMESSSKGNRVNG